MLRTLLFSFILLVIGCVSYDDFDTGQPEGAYGLAKALEDDSRYEEALLQYRDVKNRFPYSKYATLAELQVAEIHYKKEAFAEAQGAYQLFKELHPKHPRVDYVTFMIGESIFMQLPETIDRDLTQAPLASQFYQQLLNDYPTSPHVQKSRERINECMRKMAEKELYIADFYFRTNVFISALVRYEKYLSEFPRHDQVAHALLHAGLAAAALDEPNKKQKYFREVIEKFPDSSHAMRAKKEL